MKTNNKAVGIVLSILSVAVSAVFVIYGLRVSFTGETPVWVLLFSLACFAYGVLSALLLVFAWFRSGVKAQTGMKYLALIFLVAFVLASLDVGIISGQEVLGIVVVAIMLWLNWFSVKTVAALQHVA